MKIKLETEKEKPINWLHLIDICSRKRDKYYTFALQKAIDNKLEDENRRLDWERLLLLINLWIGPPKWYMEWSISLWERLVEAANSTKTLLEIRKPRDYKDLIIN